MRGKGEWWTTSQGRPDTLVHLQRAQPQLRFSTVFVSNIIFQPYVCDICDRAFADRSNMRSHRATHGKNILEKNDRILILQFLQFSQFSQFSQIFTIFTIFTNFYNFHKFSQLLILILDPKRRHECDICHKTFSRNAVLEKHKKQRVCQRNRSRPNSSRVEQISPSGSGNPALELALEQSSPKQPSPVATISVENWTTRYKSIAFNTSQKRAL